ncbi:MAG: type II toxin-antitoxin system RelE/ParE family toxin [Armatimonadetes bacterium]|nr:type II toxin-antitoxin system RelE/ParE family toxin [Armatimonadota bacterium]
MRAEFHPSALEEYTEAAAHYAAIRDDLAEEFLQEMEHGIARILEYPHAWPVIDQDARRYVLKRFPYGVYYRVVDEDTIFVVAVMHQKRRPGYWRHRLTEIGP